LLYVIGYSLNTPLPLLASTAIPLALVSKGQIGYKYFYLKVEKMKKKGFILILSVLALCWVVKGAHVYAQQSPKTLTILYSNNLNGEIDPCPT
jgi:hypothetical protein